MNDQDFILLMEEYFDGSLTPDGRTALRTELQSSPTRRTLFENQARQNIRLHAQTSPIDFTESQRIAIAVMDTVKQYHHPATFADIMKEQTFRERLAALREGLRAPRYSGKNRYARFVLMRLVTPPAVAIALSAIIILSLISVVPKMFPIPEPTDDPITINLIDPPPVQVPDPKPPDSKPDPDQIAPISTDETPPDIANPPTPAPTPEPSPTPNPQPPPFVRPSPIPRFLDIPSTLTNRDPTKRDTIIKQIPRGNETERAVTNALQWLKNNQRPDGSWAGQDPAAMTGLALLAYLAHNETPSSPTFGPTVQRALEYLASKQNANGLFSHDVYAHAIATYAMAEAYSLTRIMTLRTSMDRGIAVIIAGQQSSGGFDYKYAKNTRFDTSVAGWQIQALKASFIAGGDQPGLAEAIKKSIHFLQNLSFAQDGSGFVYAGETTTPSASGAKWTMTGVGTLSLQLLGVPSAPQVRQGLKLLSDISFEWPRNSKPTVYGFYYVTQAKFQSGNSPAWERWNRPMQQHLLRAQKTDGHWEGGDYDKGSHVYTTTLCTLMLEVYYRYLPTFSKPSEGTAPQATSSGEIQVHVQ